jgi:hypothetical protein
VNEPDRQYRQRHERALAEAVHHERWSGRLSLARLGVFVVGFGLAWIAFVERAVRAGWVLLPVVLFGVLVVLHDRRLKAATRERRRQRWYGQGLDRLSGDWAGQGVSGEAHQRAEHPYAGDLDLFGPGSLFERLATVRTAAGEAILADWLQEGATERVVAARQEAIRELTDRLELRESLALAGEEVRATLHPAALTAWGEAPPRRWSFLWHIAAGVASVLTVSTLVAWLGFDAFGGSPSPFVAALLVHTLLLRYLGGRSEPIVEALEKPERDLEVLAGLLERIEAEPFSGPRLVALRRELAVEGVPPSRRVAQLRSLIELLDARRNQMFAPIAILLFWGFHLAALVERWRQRCGPRLGTWLQVAGEVEVLAALGGYAYENPQDPFPEVVAGNAPHFDARGLAHPLLPLSQAVRNDVRLGTGGTEAPQLLVLSGSNMSGKSTLLRAVGVNTVLALLGAPVRAEGLRLAPMALGASIRVNDSLAEGKSRFYAEITRLRQVVELCGGQRPVLFLLDELLAGTNSHDRRIGAAAVVRSLLDRGAAGMLTTHDLALAEIADSLAAKAPGRAANVHFEDTLKDGELHFDYRLRPGVVERSNALELMRAVGLEV